MKTRFAPSPTGDLHLGGAWTALASWALARHHGGQTNLRVEDIDTPRVVKGASERILEDLTWLGLDWDEGPITQSSRLSLYEDALARLEALGLTYRCDCSRAEIARAASAPHQGEDAGETLYPGTCRDAPQGRTFKRDPAIRLRVPHDGSARIAFDDLIHGHIEEDVARAASDFVLRRGDGVFAYQLVVAIDDAATKITHVVRADDLLGSTARQILLMRLLGYDHAATPTYAHVPLVVASDGNRLAKRTRGATVRDLRDQGLRAEDILGHLAHGLGLSADATPRPAAAIARTLRPPTEWRRETWRIRETWST